MTNTARAALIMICGALSQPVLAHHSGAVFDPTHTITAKGTVKIWQWSNPHSWLTVMIDDGHGNLESNALELGSPNTLFRSGWRVDTFKPGDVVTVVYHPRKNGGSGGALMTAQTADGKLMTWLPTAKPEGAPPDSAPAAAKP